LGGGFGGVLKGGLLSRVPLSPGGDLRKLPL